MKGIRYLKEYFATHFAAVFAFYISMAVFVMALIFMNYLRDEYLHYLREKSYETENAVMDSMQQNLNDSFRELITTASEMVTERSLLDLTTEADRAVKAGKDIGSSYLDLYNVLVDSDHLRYVSAVAVMGKEGMICQYDRYKQLKSTIWGSGNQVYLENMAAELFRSIDEGNLPRYTAYLYPQVYPDSDRRIFHVAYPLTGGVTGIRNIEYIVVITYSMEIFDAFLNTVEVPQVKYIRAYIADGNGEILYYRDEKNRAAQDILPDGKHDETLISKPLAYFGWTANVNMDETEMKAHVAEIYRKGIVLYLTVLIVYIVIIIVVMRQLLNPIHAISDSLKEAEQGNYNSKIKIEGKNEIWQLAEEYNRMADAIDEKNREIQRKNEERLQSLKQQHLAEKEALESQINAHFICNTLGCINYEAIEAGNHHVSILIKKLSNILRYTFDQHSQTVYMLQEIAWIDQYLYLQKNRYETLFDYEIRFPDAYNYWPCCKLIFQPFVENSILHGFKEQKFEPGGGIIRITGEGFGDWLKIVIEDNGRGMEPERAADIEEIISRKKNMSLENQKRVETDIIPESRRRVGIGIRNVVTRMYMFYGEELEITMKTAVGEGTVFTFRIPLPRQEGEKDS